MTYKNLILLPALAVLLLLSACKKEDNPAAPPGLNESELAAKYLEDNGDFINSSINVFVSASEVRTNQLNNGDQVILDLNTPCDFNNRGHIEGSVNLKIRDLLNYYKNNNLQNIEKVIITCSTGQQTAYAVALLRMYGYSNVYGMLWGTSSWNPALDSWTESLSSSRAPQMVTNVKTKGTPGEYPQLTTGKTSGEEITKAKIEELLTVGFEQIIISNETVFLGPDDYYIINYASLEQYLTSHVPNSVQYTPGTDLRIDTYLRTIPKNKTVVVYCSTGQTSSQAAAFLCVLGYDAKSILFGNNGMNYSNMTGKKFSSEEINNFPIVH